MPLPKPNAGETQQEFVSRCISSETKASPGRDSKQISAMCYQAWRDRNKEDDPMPRSRSNHQHLHEQVSFLHASFEETDGGRIIRNVAFLGPTSSHGYTYRQEAMAKAVKLYDGVRCFINHPSKEEEQTGRRDLMKLAGVTEGARHEDGKIKGNVKLLDDQWGQKFWNIAHTMPQAASCSHVADGKMVTEGGKRYVEEISQVISVDLVVQGATTSTVFEGHPGKEIDMEYSDIQIDELRRKRPDLVQTLTTEGAKTRDDEVKKIMEENQGLKRQVDEFNVKEAQSKKAAAIEKLLSESKLPAEAKTDLFREQLLAIDGEDFEKQAKALIEDRAKLVGGVRNMPSSQVGSGGGQIKEDVAATMAEMGIAG